MPSAAFRPLASSRAGAGRQLQRLRLAVGRSRRLRRLRPGVRTLISSARRRLPQLVRLVVFFVLFVVFVLFVLFFVLLLVGFFVFVDLDFVFEIGLHAASFFRPTWPKWPTCISERPVTLVVTAAARNRK